MIIFNTKNIDKKAYIKIIRRIIMLNAHDKTHLSGYKTWTKMKEEWDIHIIPTTQQEDYSKYYDHLNIKTSDKMAWGITGKKVIYMFVNDSKNPFVTRSNIMPLSHELMHALYQDKVGTFHITRKYDSPEGSAGTRGSSATVIVHDLWYGNKKTINIWVRFGFIYIPITILYYPIWQAKNDYPI
jgi:hypothetical protein